MVCNHNVDDALDSWYMYLVQVQYAINVRTKLVNRAYVYENWTSKPKMETHNGNEDRSTMEQLLGQMTQLLEQTHVQQQQLQEQQRQAEEQTAQLIEHLGELRLNYDNDDPTETSCDGQEWKH